MYTLIIFQCFASLERVFKERKIFLELFQKKRKNQTKPKQINIITTIWIKPKLAVQVGYNISQF